MYSYNLATCKRIEYRCSVSNFGYVKKLNTVASVVSVAVVRLPFLTSSYKRDIRHDVWILRNRHTQNRKDPNRTWIRCHLTASGSEHDGQILDVSQTSDYIVAIHSYTVLLLWSLHSQMCPRIKYQTWNHLIALNNLVERVKYTEMVAKLISRASSSDSFESKSSSWTFNFSFFCCCIQFLQRSKLFFNLFRLFPQFFSFVIVLMGDLRSAFIGFWVLRLVWTILMMHQKTGTTFYRWNDNNKQFVKRFCLQNDNKEIRTGILTVVDVCRTQRHQCQIC